MIIEDLWEPLLHGVLLSLKPERLLLFGAGPSERAKRVGQWAQASGATVDVVDPDPSARWRKVATNFESQFVLHEGPTCSCAAPVVWIDNEPNYHRVSERLAASIGAAFLVAGTAWPHGRRDAYPTPDSIPQDALHPNELGGVAPGRDRVTKKGLFEEWPHALNSGGPRNGVATAVEDFAQQNPNYHVAWLPALEGAAFLLPLDSKALETVRAFCDLSDGQQALLQSMSERIWLKTLESHRLDRKLEKLRDQMTPERSGQD